MVGGLGSVGDVRWRARKNCTPKVVNVPSTVNMEFTLAVVEAG